MNNIVEIENLTKEYETGFFKKKKVRAVDGISLSVRSGQIFGFLGGNGAGKTTTIKMLMSLLYPTSGTAKILGQDISDFTMHRKIGYCPENPYFYDYLTPRELLAYFGELFEVEKGKTKDRTEDLLEKVGLEERDRSRQLRKFSKGMLQRVGLAQSLINDPELLFLDEPMSGLDPMGRREVRELIASLRDQGKTVFMSTHILSDVEALCDEVAILRKGKLAAIGTLDELLVSQAENQVFEIVLRGLPTEGLVLNGVDQSQIVVRGHGITVRIEDESQIESVLAQARKQGGHLVSVQQTKQSLEELFVSATAD
ncbi:MAG: ABC transporter ATP-binding protein [Pyrinomonadaceae bacterium]